MIIGRKSLEKRIDEIGRQTMGITYNVLTSLSDIPCTSYSDIMTVGYRAFNHRKKRLLNWYDIHRPYVMTEHCIHNVETYIVKMMSAEANSVIFQPIRNPYHKDTLCKRIKKKMGCKK